MFAALTIHSTSDWLVWQLCSRREHRVYLMNLLPTYFLFILKNNKISFFQD